MCEGFSALITPDLTVYWAQPDQCEDGSHHIITDALGLDRNLMTREVIHPSLVNFVCIECPNWTMDTYRHDFPWVEDNLPYWFTSNEALIKSRLTSILEQIETPLEEYRDARSAAFDIYAKEYRRLLREGSTSIREKNRNEYTYNKTVTAAYQTLIQKISRIEGYIGDHNLSTDGSPAA